MPKDRPRLYLIDGSSYIFRAFYAIRPLSNSKGLPTNALYGFIRMILKLIKDEKPDKVGIIFDTEAPTFRDEMYEEYKANRKEPPDDLVPQFEYFTPIVEALSIKEISMDGYEADDVIGTLAKKAEKDGYDVTLVTGDKDFMQLVDDHIILYDTMKERRISFPEVKKKFGVRPDQVIDVMSLIGDSSDNIPGVRGIGEKTASALINQYESLDNLFENVDNITNQRAKNALKEGRGDADLSRDLVTIKLDVPIEFDWAEFDLHSPDKDKVKELFSELEFYKLMQELIPAEKNDANVENEYKVIANLNELEGLKTELKNSDTIACNFLSSSDRFVGISFSLGEGKAFYIPMAHQTLEEIQNIDISHVKTLFNDIKTKKKVLFKAKSIIKILKGLDIDIGNIEDLLLISYVVDPSNSNDLLVLGQQILGADVLDGRLETKGTKKTKKKDASEFSIEEAKQECPLLSDIIFRLYKDLNAKLDKEEDLKKIYKDLEMPLMWILLDMEEKGILIDKDKLKKLSEEYAEKIKGLEKEIFKEAGEEFVVNSPKQLSRILFEKLDLPVIKKTKTGFSTDSSVLEQLAVDYDIPKMILEYRSLAKLKSTYIDALPILTKNDGRIHTTFNQAVTATGRLSSKDPNLQNVPARTEEGMRIREAFIPDKGLKLISADYSQIELRILAHISKEDALTKAFEDGVDVHAATAAKIFNVAIKDVDKEMRGAAKTVNFGVLYGQSAYGLSQQLDISPKEADEYIKNYYASYPKVESLKDKILQDAETKGYVKTIYGRRRYIPDIKNPNKQVKAFAERTAFNAVFQGTAADIIKMAMIELAKVIKKDFSDVSMLLQVHDELVFELPESKVEAFTETVKKAMCEVVKLDVPLEVDIGIGNNWTECK